jgi:hypothetical protein
MTSRLLIPTTDVFSTDPVDNAVENTQRKRKNRCVFAHSSRAGQNASKLEKIYINQSLKVSAPPQSGGL